MNLDLEPMASDQPIHRPTRTVYLPDAWTNAPDEVQVNYYNYLSKRLIYSTDVMIGERLVYRTNAIGCRGVDLAPGQAVVGVFGDDFVHGDLSGSFVDQIHFDGCRLLNAGIEALPFKHVVDRVLEVHKAAPLTCAIVAPPRRELTPEVARMTGTDGAWEADWEAELDRLVGPPIIAFMRRPLDGVVLAGEDTEALKARFDRFLTDYCRRCQRVLLAPEPQAGGLAGLWRRVSGPGSADPAKAPWAALIEQKLAKPIAAYLKANPVPVPSLAVTPAAPGAHGPDDVGRNYPLW